MATDLFGGDTPLTSNGKQRLRKAEKEHAALLKLHGERAEKCKTCGFLCRINNGANTYLKCYHASYSHGPSTDWRAGWLACGLYKTEHEVLNATGSDTGK